MRRKSPQIQALTKFVIGASGSTIYEEGLVVVLFTTLIFMGPVIYWLVGFIGQKKSAQS